MTLTNFTVPTYLYNYVGQPAKTVDRVDSILNQFFNTSWVSIPGVQLQEIF